MKLFKIVKLEQCAVERPLTTVGYENDTAKLVIHDSHKKDYYPSEDRQIEVNK